MADMGFMPQVTELLDQVRPDGQRMLFSATLDRNVDLLVRRSSPTRSSTPSTRRPARSPRWSTTSCTCRSADKHADDHARSRPATAG